MTTIDKLGHLAYALILGGSYLIGDMNVWGWPPYLVGCAIWLVLGIKMKMSSIWVWEAGFILNGIWAWWKWA